MTLQLPTPEELGLSAGEYGDLLHGTPPWADFEESPEVDPADREPEHRHAAHADCQAGAEFVISWCGAALAWEGHRTEAEAAGEPAPICQACIDAIVGHDGICPLCDQPAG